MCEKLSKHSGKKVVYTEVPDDTTRSAGWEGCVEFGNMMQFSKECEQDIRKLYSKEMSSKLNPEMLTMD